MMLFDSWRQPTYTSSNGICIKSFARTGSDGYITLHISVYVERGNFLNEFCLCNFYIALNFILFSMPDNAFIEGTSLS